MQGTRKVVAGVKLCCKNEPSDDERYITVNAKPLAGNLLSSTMYIGCAMQGVPWRDLIGS